MVGSVNISLLRSLSAPETEKIFSPSPQAKPRGTEEIFPIFTKKDAPQANCSALVMKFWIPAHRSLLAAAFAS